MMQSMTGFASKNVTVTSSSGRKATIFLSIKSLNGRFFELNCKFPAVLSSLETDILKKLKKKLVRGHVYVVGYMANIDIIQGVIEPSLTTVRNYVSAIEKIKEEFGIAQTVTLDHLLRLPNIFNVQEQLFDATIEQELLQAIDHLADDLVEARLKEGMAITQDLYKHATRLHECIASIEVESTALVERTKTKIQHMLSEMKADVPAEAHEIQKNTLFSLLDKIDINEEISRCKSHLKNMESQLSMPIMEKGKLLDFILQELARETNTINAKCSDATVATHAINAKVEVEKMREQVQNIV